MNINQRNLYKYSQNLNLSSIAEIKNDENNPNSADNLSLTKNVEFLKDLANILENRLRTNICSINSNIIYIININIFLNF